MVEKKFNFYYIYNNYIYNIRRVNNIFYLKKIFLFKKIKFMLIDTFFTRLNFKKYFLNYYVVSNKINFYKIYDIKLNKILNLIRY